MTTTVPDGIDAGTVVTVPVIVAVGVPDDATDTAAPTVNDAYDPEITKDLEPVPTVTDVDDEY